MQGIQLNSKTLSSNGLLPQVEMHFGTFERAQKAAALLKNSKFDNSKVSISEMLFEEQGRLMILKFNSFGAYPSQLISYMLAVIDVASNACPVWKHITIPLVQNQ